MSAYEECWPVEEGVPQDLDYLNGIHYGKRMQLGIPDKAIKIAETLIDGPTMVRTNMPHMTLYNGHSDLQRIGVSVRFAEAGINSWEDALEFTNKLHVK
jgi:hypothetical protein